MYIALGRMKLEYWIHFVASEFLKDTKKLERALKQNKTKKQRNSMLQQIPLLWILKMSIFVV